MNNFTLNFTNTTQWFLDQKAKGCITKGKIDARCMTNLLCPQINNYVLRYGVAIIMIYIVGSWVNWWFFSKGYKLVPDYKENKVLVRLFGNIEDRDTRYYWYSWVLNQMGKLAIGYIVVVLYFFL